MRCSTEHWRVFIIRIDRDILVMINWSSVKSRCLLFADSRLETDMSLKEEAENGE